MQKVILILIEYFHTLLEFFGTCVLHDFALIKTHKDKSFLVNFLIRIERKLRGMQVIAYKPWLRQGCGCSIIIECIFFHQLPFRIGLLETGFGRLLSFQVKHIIFCRGSSQPALAHKKFLLDAILFFWHKVIFFIFDEMLGVNF